MRAEKPEYDPAKKADSIKRIVKYHGTHGIWLNELSRRYGIPKATLHYYLRGVRKQGSEERCGGQLRTFFVKRSEGLNVRLIHPKRKSRKEM